MTKHSSQTGIMTLHSSNR